MRAVAIWVALGLAIVVPVGLATLSPYLQYRQWIYVAAGFAGIVGLVLLLVQPLLATDALPAISRGVARRAHRIVGAGLFVAVIAHVGGLWITSPPDVVDALTFTSPTPFSTWGVIAMWAVFATASLAVARRKLRAQHWRIAHICLAIVIVVGTLVHAVLIEGAMEQTSKVVLCIAVALATLHALRRQRPWAGLWKRRVG